MMRWPRLLKSFLLPRPTRAYVVRVAVVVVVACGVFRFALRPVWLQGGSMEPTYADGSFNFCFRLRFVFRPPRVGDIVTVRFSGTSYMLLKRVVAVAGDTVEFRDGWLAVNGAVRPEPYVVHRDQWNLAPRLVEAGNVYVVGDNRGMPMASHLFGQTSLNRIVGGPLW